MGEPNIGGAAVLAGSRIIVPVEVASIDGTVAMGYIGTIGTILSGVAVNIGTIEVGTVQLVVDTATIGTIISGNVQVYGSVTASILGGIQTATIGTIVAPITVATIQSPITANIQSSPVSPNFTTVSATIIGGVGTFYGVIAAAEGSAGTLLLLSSGGTIGVVAVPANDTRGFIVERGVSVSTLIASIIGTLAVTFLD